MPTLNINNLDATQEIGWGSGFRMGKDNVYRGHVYYRLPANHQEKQSAIRVRDNDLNNYAWGGVYEPAVWPGEGRE